MTSVRKPAPSRRGRFSFITLGCKSNQYDSAAMAADLSRAGLENGETSEADIIVVNTCMVTASAEAQCRKAVRQARRENPRARLVVSGCMPCGVRDLSTSLPEADTFLLPKDRGRLTGLLGLGADPSDRSAWSDWPEDPAVMPFMRDRAFLKVQDGCNASCSYCIVPMVRGGSRSLEPGRVLESIRSLMGSGYLEVVLTGIHLGQYGSDLYPPLSLEELLDLLVKEDFPGRVRLSSIEPLEVTEALVAGIRCSNGVICRHMHVPIQSGSDRILADMKRPYTGDAVREVLGRLLKAIPGMGLGCDAICGFPGETDDDFELTEGIITELKIPFVHAFPYSPRPGTRASLLKDDVPYHVKKERVLRLRSLAAANRSDFACRQLGSSLVVALESDRKAGDVMWGLADNYLRVKVRKSSGFRAGDLLEVLITGTRDGELEGEPINRIKNTEYGIQNKTILK